MILPKLLQKKKNKTKNEKIFFEPLNRKLQILNKKEEEKYFCWFPTFV